MTEEQSPQGENDVDEGLVIPPDRLPAETLAAIIEEFVTREGTDYGHADVSLEEKCRAVRGQITRGEVQIRFDPKTESINLVRP